MWGFGLRVQGWEIGVWGSEFEGLGFTLIGLRV